MADEKKFWYGFISLIFVLSPLLMFTPVLPKNADFYLYFILIFALFISSFVFAIRSLIRSRKNKTKMSYKIMPLITLVLFLIGISLAVPGVIFMKRLMNEMICQGYLYSLGGGARFYAKNHDDQWPPQDQWSEILTNNEKGYTTPETLHCPCNETQYSYAMNKNLPEF